LRLSLAAASLAIAVAAACSGGEEYKVGDQVTAALGSGEVTSLYGKLVEIEVAHTPTWVLGSSLQPPAKELDVPEGDGCGYDVGARVRALPDGKKLRMKGTVVEAYGKVALVLFDGGGTSWRRCEKLRGKKTATPASTGSKPTSSSSGSSGSSSGKCLFRPEKGKHVRCSSFSAGKCRAGAAACKPPTRCVFRPEKGKYVKCTTFSHGKCKSGSVACKPPSKCVYRPEKGKYVKCTTFGQGKCKSGSVACKP
jgi:hypothetical protein